MGRTKNGPEYRVLVDEQTENGDPVDNPGTSTPPPPVQLKVPHTVMITSSSIFSSLWDSRQHLCRSRFNLRMMRLFVAVFFFVFFVIQFKSGPFTNPTHYISYSSANFIQTIRANSSSGSQRSVAMARVFSNSSQLEDQPKAEPMIATTVVSSKDPFQSCPMVPPKLVGRLKVLTESPPMEELERRLPDIEIGGRFRPKDCQSKHRVAIIIPYRQRLEHLQTLLLNLHPMLKRQNIDYGIYVVEQAGNGPFNRAKLMNIGYAEALKQYDYDCFIFHDVDLIPEDDRNLYTCPENPRHMSVAIDKFRYRLPYKDIFGGVSALTKKQFQTVNGFSNEFWGWGGEDDDMSNRIRHHKLTISRYPANIARYKMLKHSPDTPNADRYKKLYNGWKRFQTDGISSLKYKIVDISFKKLYVLVKVDVFPPKQRRKRPLR